MLVLAAVGPLAAQSGPGADPFELPRSSGAPAAGEIRNAAPAADAYDRLKQRSAPERWESLRREWLRDAPQVTYQPQADVPPPAPNAAAASTTVPTTPTPSGAPAAGFRPTRSAVPQTASSAAEAFDPFQAPGSSAPLLPAPALPGAVPGSSAGSVQRFVQEPTAPRAPDFGPAADAQPAPAAQPAAPSDPPPQTPLPTVPAPTPIGPPAPARGAPLDKPIRQITPFHDYVPTEQEATFRAVGELPAERPTPRITLVREQKPFPPSCFHWEPTDMFHNPLYFNDTLLERYGHTFPECVQPFVSVGLFSAQLMGLPYQMAIDGVCEKRYVVGYDRPGDCVPYHIPQVPLNAKAAATTAGFYTGMIFLIP